MQARSTRTTASVGWTRAASGTSSTTTSPGDMNSAARTGTWPSLERTPRPGIGTPWQAPILSARQWKSQVRGRLRRDPGRWLMPLRTASPVCDRPGDRDPSTGGETHDRSVRNGAPLESTIARLSQSPPGAPARQFARGDSHERNTFFTPAHHLDDGIRPVRPASVGPRGWRIVGQRVADRRRRRPVRRRVGRDRGRSDHRDVGRIDDRGPDHQREPDPAVRRHPCRCASAADRADRSRWWTRRDGAGGRPSGENEPDHRRRRGCGRHAPQDGCGGDRTGCASDGSGSTRWRAIVAARLPSQRWPDRAVHITVVDAHTGEPVVFDRHSGVDLVDAVAASTPAAPPTASATTGTSTAATAPSRMPTWLPATGGFWCSHRSAARRGIRWSGAPIWQRRSTSCAPAAAGSRRSSRVATPSTCSAPVRWICRCVRQPLEPVTTRAEPSPGSSPTSGADPATTRAGGEDGGDADLAPLRIGRPHREVPFLGDGWES